MTCLPNKKIKEQTLCFSFNPMLTFLFRKKKKYISIFCFDIYIFFDEIYELRWDTLIVT